MTIIITMVPAVILAATEDALRTGISKANKVITRIKRNRAVYLRRSRSQRRWA